MPLTDRTEGNLVIATRRGAIKKTKLSEYANIRKSGKIAINLVPGDSLIGVGVTDGNSDIMVASHEGKCIRFNESSVRATSRDSMGVKAMNLEGNDYMVDMLVLKEGYDILTVT